MKNIAVVDLTPEESLKTQKKLFMYGYRWNCATPELHNKQLDSSVTVIRILCEEKIIGGFGWSKRALQQYGFEVVPLKEFLRVAKENRSLLRIRR